MSNQFYDYISSMLLSFFNEQDLKAGDRYYLQLDKKEEVDALYSSLRLQQNVRDFVYKHDLGSEYKTFAIYLNDIRLVIARTSETVKPDFLVTLRNQVGEQQGVWKNTALLSLVSEQLDSIQGGSSDLQKEGMPLHPNYLYQKLKIQIDEFIGDKVDRIILDDYMQGIIKEQPYQQITFFDFEEIFSTLMKGSIDDKDYVKFGLFRDGDLATFTGNKLKERLALNKELFDFVKRVHDFGLEKDELEKKFSPASKNKLIDENWSTLPFSDVNRFHEEYKKLNKKTKVELKELSVKDGLTFWNKPQKETTAGNRKRHVIIFNPEIKEEVEIQISFSIEGGNVKSLAKEFLKHPKGSQPVEIKLGRTSLNAVITTEKTKTTFIKFAYRHDNKSTLGVEINIAIVPIEPESLSAFKTSYFVNPSKSVIELQYEGNELTIGSGYTKKNVEIEKEKVIVDFTSDDLITMIPLAEAFNDDEELQISIRNLDTDSLIPLLLKNELPESTPITGMRIWKLKREHRQDFEIQNNRLLFGNREFYFHSEYKCFFNWEKEWVDQLLKSAELDSEEVIPIDLELNIELREAYNRFVNYFRSKSNIPSLCYYSDELITRSKEYVQAFIKEIQSFIEGHEAGKKGRDLFRLGTLTAYGKIFFTPFHPLVVAYQLKIQELLDNEEVDNSILNRLKPEGLIPFIYNEQDELYKPDSQKVVPEWIVFKPVNEVSVSDANQYLAKVIEDKIAQFKEHFEYLFIDESQAPLQINVINITNDREVLRGLILWMLQVIKNNGPEALKPVEVTLYHEEEYLESAFDLFSRTDSIDDFQVNFDLTLYSKEYEAHDLLRFIREKLFYFKQRMTGEYKYAHISFYKMYAQEKYALQPMSEMISGMTLDGLYSSVSSMKGEENYRSGFGTKAYQVEDINLLSQTAYYLNELAANMSNGGNNSYHKGEAIFSRTTVADEKTLEKIFGSSYWVTFVDPSVDLDFFNQYGKNLVVIHYSDQYSSSSRYDAITVTDKSEQYYAVIKEFLKAKEVEGTEENVRNTVKAFNTFNGEWLLRIIGSKGHYSREKLSIISSIKFALSYFDHPNILWVPISLEEILRVAGAVGLSKSEGVFTAKNLGVSGSHSDDLLLIGLEKREEELFLHFYPIEVKIGANKNDVLDKAKYQVTHTKKIFKEALTDSQSFTSGFYRNFFAQLFIANAKKLAANNIWDNKNYDLSDDILERLLKDRYVISNDLESIIGVGAILSFQRDAYIRSAVLENDITFLNLTEFDGYQGLVSSIEEMHEWIQERDSDFIKEDLLSYTYHKNLMEPDNPETDHIDKATEDQSEYSSQPSEVRKPNKEDVSKVITKELLEETKEPDRTPASTPAIEPSNSKELDQVRILIGKVEKSNRNIYWEYGNKSLANRHLLITGKSGQGKTYFMQCLLLEKSKQGIPSIVIDYTEGFLPNQLEPEFVQYMGNKLKHKIVYSEKLPINPFKKNERDIGGITIPENNTDVAERIKSVFSAVYKSLGVQQLNAIYEATLQGLEMHGDRMNLIKLKEALEEDGSSYAKTALSQIRPLIDRNPFRHEEIMDWSDVVDSEGDVFIIQLTGYPRDVQLMITEFILWDLWNFSVQHGNKNQPMPVIMDEAQNLDHTEKSPSARILTEGRKFGWSAWYATQFLKSQLGADELARLQNASQKIYFAPPEQEMGYIATSLSADPSDKKRWENVLSSLKKGQCIVHGPILKENGELTQPVATVVNITPLTERI